MTTKVSGLHIHIKGVVQGVGFRPFVYSLAKQYNLKGWVLNSSSGVEIEVSGKKEDIDRFTDRIQNNPPPLARIDQFETTVIAYNRHETFEILSSQPQPGEFVPVSADVSICEDCQRELFDPANSRYRYPFINCTNCGPRFTIIKDIPYDRPSTTMSTFEMCPECRAEYENPLDRRFHAQPIACPKCGPQLRFLSKNGLDLHGEAALQETRRQLANGKIIAIKGLGGYHLACDACNSNAVIELRNRKQRSDKPFALMAYDVDAIKHFCWVSEKEQILLSSRQRPIVLLRQKEDSQISFQVAPQQNHLGVMLPYTPLHLLLLEPEINFPNVLVMTSGNISEEPIAFIDEDAQNRLSELADGFLIHDRPIHIRTDDSVARISLNRVYFSRRSRGYAPDSIMLPFETSPILATGTELKNTFTLGRSNYAFISHHIGDLENYETLTSFEQGIHHFENLFKIDPAIIACDLHPDYLATRYAVDLAESADLPIHHVQHHHAHFASCLVDNHWGMGDKKAIGVIMDGTGLGTDGKIWGGEIIYGNYQGFERRFHLEYMPLPGGDAAIRNPARTCLAYLWQSGIQWEPDLPALQFLQNNVTSLLLKQLEGDINVHLTSSMGRLFDAVSSILGICQVNNYEGQAAMALEARTIDRGGESNHYPIHFAGTSLLISPILKAILDDVKNSSDTSTISTRFHNTIVEFIKTACLQIQQDTGCSVIALSGGVWQNEYLLTHTHHVLSDSGFTLLWHDKVPTNDGGVSLGQLAVAVAKAE